MKHYIVPLSIIGAGALIALSIFMVSVRPQTQVAAAAAAGAQTITPIRGVQPDDHIRGNPNAEIVFVEYSDPECPFCKNFQETMKQVIADYGASGRVAWVYRHLPLTQLHSKASKEAEAFECAGDQGGNDAFWKYADLMYETTQSNNTFDLSKLPDLAVSAGLDPVRFKTCLSSNKFAPRVATDMNEAIKNGANGTPYTVILYAGTQIDLPGAQDYDVIKQLLATMLTDPTKASTSPALK